MKRATRNLILKCGVLVALGWGAWWRMTPAREGEAGKAAARPIVSAERQSHPIRDLEAMQWLAQAERDPEEAANEAASKHPEALAGILATWAGRDPAAAERWAKEQNGSLRQQALSLLAVEAARANLEVAGGLAAAMEDGPAKHEAYAFIAAQWAAQDADGALEWLKGIADAELKSAVERRAIPAMAESHPLLAANYAISGIQDSHLQQIVVPEIIGRWVQSDPQAAAEWVQQMNQPALRERSLRVLLDIWRDRDAAAARQWLNRLSEGPFRDQALAVQNP